MLDIEEAPYLAYSTASPGAQKPTPCNKVEGLGLRVEGLGPNVRV